MESALLAVFWVIMVCQYACLGCLFVTFSLLLCVFFFFVFFLCLFVFRSFDVSFPKQIMGNNVLLVHYWNFDGWMNDLKL